MDELFPICRVAATILNKQSQTTDRGWSSSFGGWARCQQLLALKTEDVKQHCTRSAVCTC